MTEPDPRFLAGETMVRCRLPRREHIVNLDVGDQRGGEWDMPADVIAKLPASCVRCRFSNAEPGSDWCGPCHPRNPNPPPLSGDAGQLWARMVRGA